MSHREVHRTYYFILRTHHRSIMFQLDSHDLWIFNKTTHEFLLKSQIFQMNVANLGSLSKMWRQIIIHLRFE